MSKVRDKNLIQLDIDNAWDNYEYIMEKYNFWRFQVEKIEAKIKELGEEKRKAEDESCL